MHTEVSPKGYYIKSLIFKVLSKHFSKIIWVSDSCYDDFAFKNALSDKSQSQDTMSKLLFCLKKVVLRIH